MLQKRERDSACRVVSIGAAYWYVYKKIKSAPYSLIVFRLLISASQISSNQPSCFTPIFQRISNPLQSAFVVFAHFSAHLKSAPISLRGFRPFFSSSQISSNQPSRIPPTFQRISNQFQSAFAASVSYTHLRVHQTLRDLVSRLFLS